MSLPNPDLRGKYGSGLTIKALAWLYSDSRSSVGWKTNARRVTIYNHPHSIIDLSWFGLDLAVESTQSITRLNWRKHRMDNELMNINQPSIIESHFSDLKHHGNSKVTVIQHYSDYSIVLFYLCSVFEFRSFISSFIWSDSPAVQTTSKSDKNIRV